MPRAFTVVYSAVGVRAGRAVARLAGPPCPLRSRLNHGMPFTMARQKRLNPRKRARQLKGKDPLVGVRMPPELTARVDAWAKELSVTRSEAMRQFAEKGLEGCGCQSAPSAEGA